MATPAARLTDLGLATTAPVHLNLPPAALVEQALHEARFNKSKAAKALGLTRQQLYVRMRRHGLE